MRAFAKDCVVPKSAPLAYRHKRSTFVRRAQLTQWTVIAWDLATWTAAFECVLADAADIVFILVFILLLAWFCIGLDVPLPGGNSVERLNSDLHVQNDYMDASAVILVEMWFVVSRKQD